MVTVIDDIPINYTPAAQSIANSGGSGVTGDLDTEGTALGGIGADEPGTMKISSFTNGGGTFTTNGADLTLNAGGSNILLSGFGTATLTGFVDRAGGATGVFDAFDTVVFTMTLQPGSDTYQFDLFQHIDDGSGVTFTDLSGGQAGLKQWLRVEDPVAGGVDNDILITTFADPAGVVNSDADDIGVNNQSIDNGQGLRLDFVSGLAGDQSVEGGWSFSTIPPGPGHYTVSTFSFGLIQVGGNSPPNTSTVLVRAINEATENGHDISFDRPATRPYRSPSSCSWARRTSCGV